MLSQRDKSVIVNILDEILGVGTSLKGNEQASLLSILSPSQEKVTNKLRYTTMKNCWVCDLKVEKYKLYLENYK